MIKTEFEWPPFKNAEAVTRAFAEKAKALNVEILQAVDDEGNIVCENVGDYRSVNVPPEARGHWLMHSHPNLNAPISIQDVIVINMHDVKMNMAVCHDGSVSWTSGFKEKGMPICMAANLFTESDDVQGAANVMEFLAGERVGCSAANWWMLDFFVNDEPELKDLHVLAGTDTKPLQFAQIFGVRLPGTFTYRADE